MSPTPDGPPTQERDFALKQYDAVLKLLTSDTQVYWVRSQFLLVANATLLGFEINSFPGQDIRTSKLVVLALTSIIGVVMCVIWCYGIRVGRRWMNHWKSALRQWEEVAFSNVNLYRARPVDVPKPGQVSIKTAVLFLVVWAAVATYMLICLCLRLFGCPLP